MLECHPILLKNTKAMEQQVRQEKKEEAIEVSPNLVMAPGKMRVIKRNGKVVAFDEEKIKVAARLELKDIEIADQLNMRIKLLGITELLNNKLFERVHP